MLQIVTVSQILMYSPIKLKSLSWNNKEAFSFKKTSLILCCCSVTQSCQLLVTPWTTTHQASLSFSISWRLLQLMSIESMMPSNHFILYRSFCSCPQSFPASGSFPMSWLFASGSQSIWSFSFASASVLPMNIQGWFPLGWTCWISLQSKGLSSVSFNTTV